MYGLVHRAIRDMVLTHHGPQVWEQIRSESGVGDDAFLAMQSYDDAIVLQLVAAASKVLDISQAECLDVFGQFWVLDTAVKHYGNILDSFGDEIWEFLGNLNKLHDRISSTFQGYDAPSFQLETSEDGTHLLHYRSSRQGLTPFVIGLLKGLAQHFDTELVITVVAEELNDQGQHTKFCLETGGSP
ncbi:MAG: heme NO-binding domain-containing protein [Mariniblastus sp.]|nr:heme NO-binding domain-containing protein [Mariniblastus sp.]